MRRWARPRTISGRIPYLNRVDLLYSVPRAGDENVSSQLFHVDPEGLTQVKFFINVFDVGDGEGPFTFIPADETARIIRDVNVLRRQQGKPHAGRYLDEEITAVGGGGSIVRVKGPQGSGVAVDTSRCLHLGSRVNPGSFRLCLYIQDRTTRELGNAFDVERYRHDRVRHSAVQHSVASAGTEVAAPHQTEHLAFPDPRCAFFSSLAVWRTCAISTAPCVSSPIAGTTSVWPLRTTMSRCGGCWRGTRASRLSLRRGTAATTGLPPRRCSGAHAITSGICTRDMHRRTC